MKLSKLFNIYEETNQLKNSDYEVRGLCLDSRQARAGYMFFCIKGIMTNGHKYINSAIANGAGVIVHTEDLSEKRPDVIYIKVDNITNELNRVADIFYDRPSKTLKMFGVTGTNGKSTVCNVIKQIYSEVEPCGYMGTISIDIGTHKKDPDLTTPDTLTTQENLSEMRDSGLKAAAIEVSSHGLDMGRVDAVDFDYAVFTNLSHDHLDYHKTMRNYLNAKKNLFSNLKPEAIAIINRDDPCFDEINSVCKCKTISFGIESQADYMANHIAFSPDSTEFILTHDSICYTVRTNLAAKYNVYNLLAAIATLHQSGVPMDVILERAKYINQIPGRMEYIKEGQNFDIIVDYAHTPDGFEKIFTYAKHITGRRGKLIAVFGAAGKRDKIKRPIFGKIASKYCDKLILTEQDVRDENAIDIVREIVTGIEDTDYEYIENRKMAIEYAIRKADINDCILILGKGDEGFLYGPYGREPWMGDNNVARDALRQLMYETCGNC